VIRRGFPAFLAVAAGLVAGGAAAQLPAENSFTIDLFVFSQEDDLGQPYKAEGMGYQGTRLTAVLRVTEATALEMNAGVSYIQNDPAASPPPAIHDLRITSASADIVALDASSEMSYRPPGAPWTLACAATYHHQDAFVAPGADASFAWDMNGGDTILAGSWGLRVAFPKLRYWDGRFLGRDRLASNNSSLGIVQTLSPSLVLSLTVQYTHQIGYLADAYNYVVIYVDGTPARLTDERLPDHRDRFQGNVRLRFSPAGGIALGLDGSLYADDWGLHHAAAEPNAAFPIAGGVDGRVWYRLSSQEETRFFRRTPAAESAYQTQDSDLASFTMSSGGTTIRIPLRSGPGTRWESKVSVFGFHRSDEVYAAGGNLGISAAW
jgi:hypothetical protein